MSSQVSHRFSAPRRGRHRGQQSAGQYRYRPPCAKACSPPSPTSAPGPASRPSCCCAKAARSSPAPTSPNSRVPRRRRNFATLFRQLEQLPVPVVAAMHGTAMGGGLEIALACHYRVALGRERRFGFPEVTLGIIPGAGGTQRMPRLIGVEKTLEMILAARPVDVATGLRAGLHRCASAGRFARRPRSPIAQSLLRKAPPECGAPRSAASIRRPRRLPLSNG